ncbi:hypothetical protein OUY36_00495 [Stutzerimonas sp. R40042]|uniref:hypothetical protein n=1 Tax=Stutzerimonas sp. R40042 TaxID=2998559 RepID=UPI0022778A15|nr:hypothetical protein [Stutzerimonas sp. R40042]WAE62089.1 hypothetical protein OUY36_00495 [Stutzerimonas sp. R40042]
MAEHKPINWAYPFPSKDTSHNPLQLLTHMAQAKGGFYPTGENGLWHGGVHFDEGTAAAFDQSSVRCIADGEVIAYRIDERYPVSEFTDHIPMVKRAPFSTGFVLVRHSLQPPPLKNADGSIVEAQTPPSLTLYSLYMHLLDWAGYQARADLPRPAFWETKRYTVNTQHDGLSVRAGPSKHTTKLSELSKGAEITIGETEGEFSKLVSLISGTAQPALSADDEGQLPGYVSTSLLKPHSEPAEYGKVIVLDSGLPIKAGDLIGHPGLYQNHDSAAQHMVHVELFSCDDVPAFIARSCAWASRLPDDQKTLLKVYKGASKLITHRDDINAENPPKLDDDGTQIGVDLIIPQSLLDGLPTSRKIQTKDGADNTMYWWRLDGLFADVDGNPIDGWLAEQELITTRHSPWEWEGFQCIEETGTPVEKLAYAFNARGLLSSDEQHNYRAQISKADGGPILALARLHDIVDTDKDGVLTSKEIRTALAKPWQAQALGQLIIRYESEWHWNKSKWDELDPLLEEDAGKPNLIWQTEKQRIKTLSWWAVVAEALDFSPTGNVWHIQPYSLPLIFNGKPKDLITLEMLKTANSQISDEYAKAILPNLNKYALLYNINTPLLIAHFLSQVGHESGFKVRSENLSYSAKRMREVFGCRNNIRGYDTSTDDCKIFPRLRPKLWTEPAKYERNPENLGSYVYSGRNGNGDEESRDGYKYRGRGIIQLTGKNNYIAYTRIHNEKNEQDHQDFVKNPDLVTSNLQYGIESAFVWWEINNLNRRILNSYNARTERNITDHVADVSAIVNGGTIGLPERVRLFKSLRGLLNNEPT